MIYYIFSFTILIGVNLLRSDVTAGSVGPNVGDGNGIECDEINKPGWSILSLANVTLGAWPWICINSRYTETTLNKEISKLSPDIFDAAARGYIGFAQYYFDMKGDDLYENFNDEDVTPLHLAIANGHLRIVKYFVTNDFGISCNLISARTKRSYSTYSRSSQCAAFFGQLEILKYLLTEITYSLRDRKRSNEYLEKLAIAAAEGGQQDVLKYLVDEEGFIVKTDDGHLLFMAVKSANVNMLKYLLYEKNVDATILSEVDTRRNDLYECDSWAFLCNAAAEGKLEAVIFFVENFNYTQSHERWRWSRPLVAAVKGGSLPVIKYMIEEKGADIKSSDHLLHIAAGYGHLAVVKYLVEHQHMDVDLMSNMDVTPLYEAVYWGKLDVVKYLAGVRNASLNVTLDSNALHEASGRAMSTRQRSENFLKIVKFLVDDMKMISRIDEVDRYTKSAVVRAACYGEPDILRFLVEERHANLPTVFPGNKTFLHLVAENMLMQRDYFPVFKYLIEEKGFKVGARTAWNETVIYLARVSTWGHVNQETLTYLEQELSKENKAV